MSEKSLFVRMSQALRRTANTIGRAVDTLSGRKLDDAFFEDLEETLILADCGVAAATGVVKTLRERTREAREYRPEEVRAQLVSIIADRLRNDGLPPLPSPTALLFVGVNGVGKTTSIGKLSHYFATQGKKVIVAAGDTFRAAAVEQLAVWADRARVEIVSHQSGADPGAVLFDAIAAARSRHADVILCDTAGRLHNKDHLMQELAKVARVAQRADIPRYTLLVIDASTGQNALSQAKAFIQAAQVDAIIATKLDGTAKGGVILALAQELNLPVWFVGLGESLDDLQPFDAEAFAQGLLGGDS